MLFGINTTCNISKLLYLISRAVREWNLKWFWNITSGIFAKYHLQIMLLLIYTTTTPKSFVIFTCRYFKLSGNTTALSQSNCRHLSCNSINNVVPQILNSFALWWNSPSILFLFLDNARHGEKSPLLLCLNDNLKADLIKLNAQFYYCTLEIFRYVYLKF